MYLTIYNYQLHFLIFQYLFLFFRSRTVHIDIIKVVYLPTDEQENCFKKIINEELKNFNINFNILF
jgi:hypothetical protein